jgi:hypothetical protein
MCCAGSTIMILPVSLSGGRALRSAALDWIFAFSEARHLRLRLRPRHSRLQSRGQCQGPLRPIRHPRSILVVPDASEQIPAGSVEPTLETGRRHADNRPSRQLFSDDVELRSQPLPARPRHHRLVRVLRLVARRKESAQKRLDPQDREVILGHRPSGQLTSRPSSSKSTFSPIEFGAAAMSVNT